jgi:GDP/UDP-N,N'-diacetylbacillosamine 2-epimerase (hydrolysing)
LAVKKESCKLSNRRIFFLTGARSEYDILYPVIKAVSQTPSLQAEVIAAAAHLSLLHGMTIDLIRADGFPIVGSIESLIPEETWEGRSRSFARLIDGLTPLLAANRPDLLFVVGDREEPLAGAIVANFLRIPVAHLHGGDRCIASDVDEVLRPAISKLSHLHFTATEGHRQRLIRMGEQPETVWVSGAPGLDRLRNEPDVPDSILNETYGVDVHQPFFILIQHPASTLNPEDGGREMTAILDGILSLGHPVFCSYPNTDPGNQLIRAAIDEAKSRHSHLIVYNTLPRDHFVSLYRRCSAIVGNSSSIVLESSFLKVPGILVGPRQNLRETDPNVLRIEPTSEAVRSACLRALEDEAFRQQVRQAPSLYGDGHAAARIADVLAAVELSQDLLLKTITY